MPMRLELGALTVEVERQEEAAAFLRGLFRHLTNKEVAQVLGVTDKTVRRWQRAGRLPSRGAGQLTLLDLLRHLGAMPQEDAAAPAPTAAGRTQRAKRPSAACQSRAGDRRPRKGSA